MELKHTEILDKIFLALSLVSNAKTDREEQLEEEIVRLKERYRDIRFETGFYVLKDSIVMSANIPLKTSEPVFYTGDKKDGTCRKVFVEHVDLEGVAIVRWASFPNHDSNDSNDYRNTFKCFMPQLLGFYNKMSGEHLLSEKLKKSEATVFDLQKRINELESQHQSIPIGRYRAKKDVLSTIDCFDESDIPKFRVEKTDHTSSFVVVERADKNACSFKWRSYHSGSNEFNQTQICRTEDFLDCYEYAPENTEMKNKIKDLSVQLADMQEKMDSFKSLLDTLDND